MTPQINLLYVHAGWIGYGRVGVQIATELERRGWDVYDHLEGSDAQYSDDNTFVPPHLWMGDKPASGRSFGEGRRAGRSNIACWISVPSHGTGWFEGQVPIVFTMWESMKLPEAMTESLHEFETLIVPSQQNVELFAPFHDNIKYVPLGIDPIKWQFRERKAPETEFRFLCGGSGRRKGNDLVVKAFKKLWGKGGWGDGPIPTLTLKSPKGENFYGDRISTVGGYLSAEEEVELYANAHCYVQPSRGEGFGLQPLQAIAQGCPTILTNAHGQADYAHLGHLGEGLRWSPTKSDYFMLGDAGEWWEPDFDDLCEQMLDVYKHYGEACEWARDSSTIALADWTWAKTTDKFIDAIGKKRCGPYVGNGDWHRVEQKMYRVVTNRDHYHEVAGRAYAYKRGEEYYVPADIKRILFEAGYLTADCIAAVDAGLAVEQVERFEKNRAQYENCPTCFRPLASA